MHFMDEREEHFEEMRSHLIQHLMKYSDHVDIQGLELGSLIRILANYYSAAIIHKASLGELSGPRMGILLRLLAAEENGNLQGINPTMLSRYQHVKKNTISSLLRGLEESGLIERTLDPQDKRVFLIRITEAGKDLIKSSGPKRLAMMNDLSSGLTQEEKAQLIILLEKLRHSIKDKADFSCKNMHAHLEDDISKQDKE